LPGPGNITGFALGEFTMSGKLLEVLKQVAPQVSRVVVMYNPLQVPQVGRLASIQTAAPSLGVQVRAATATNADQITQIIEGFGSEPRRRNDRAAVFITCRRVDRIGFFCCIAPWSLLALSVISRQRNNRSLWGAKQTSVSKQKPSRV
jgi:hypothetical protein